MKKKALALGLAVLMIAILSMSSLAWFTAEDEVTNVFEVGSVDIVQHEKEHDGDGELVDFTQNKVLMPVVNTTTPSEDPNYQEKIITVESTGENPAYVRTFIAVPTNLLPVLELDYNEDAIGNSWLNETVAGQTVDVDDINYTVYTFTYATAIGEGQTQTVTDVLLEGVYMEAHTDCQENDQGVKQYCYMDGDTLVFCDYDVNDPIKVLVATQAVQMEGFEGVGASQALDAAFGTDAHPFG